MPTASDIRHALQCGNAGCACHKGPNTHCPAHADSDPSLTVHDAADGKILVNCKTGCAQDAVIASLKDLGLWPEHKPEAPTQNGSGSTLVATYEYRDIAGQLVALKGRFEYPGGKTFKWKLPRSDSWAGLGGKPMSEIPLWGAEKLHDWPVDEDVFFVEGEKAAVACRALGLLAVTCGGGASTTDFGASLEALQNRHVILWPDNDEPGRRYMARVQAALRPIAKSITIVQPPVPEKGDAVEYFGGGGTVSDLIDGAPPTAPTIDYLAHDAVRVRIPSGLGTLSFAFTSMEKTTRDLNCELEVRVGNSAGEPYTQRLNLLSGSAITEMRRNLDLVYGKDLGWAQVLNTAIAKARWAFLDQDRAVRLADIPDPGPPSFLIHDLLPLGVPTVWFGTGSSCKTYVALRAAISVAMGLPFMGMPATKQGGVMLIDYEDTSASFKFRCVRMLAGLGLAEYGNPPLHHWPARGIPLADQIEAIKAKVAHEGIPLVIIDSAAAACGGKPEDAEVALRYFMALQKLGDGVTTLTIAHVSKGSDEMRPFGSVFWENQARRTVNFSRTDDEDSDDMDVGVFFRKVNQGKKPKPMAFHVHFANDIGPVTMERVDLKAVPALNCKRGLKWQAWDVLTTSAMTVYEIAAAIGNEDPLFIKTLASAISDAKTMFVRIGESESKGGRGNQVKWARLSKEATPEEETPVDC